MWINTKQTKHKPVSRCPFTAWEAVRKSAATTIPGRRNEYEIKKKLLAGTLLALCGALLVLCSVLAIGWSKAAKTDTALPEVRNNGTAIQWKYSDETDWRDLVALTELRGAAGEAGKDGADGENGTDGKNGINGTNGKDGINGVDGKDGVDGKAGANGKDGINGKSIEVQRATEYIQWRYEGDEWQNLVAIADITGPAGQNGKDGANGKTPEFRVNENTLQWRYVGDEIWLNLYDLTALKGADGRDGADGINGKDGVDGKDGADGLNGADGKDGNTPFIGENGNWWIGTNDTGVKAEGKDGSAGEKGDTGEKGEKGDKGDKGDKGQNGSCAGWFYGTLWTKGDLYKENGAERPVGIKVYKEAESGGLVSTYMDEIYLKKGHTYSVTISASMELQSHEDRSGNYSVQMTDNYDDGFCREATRIKRDGVKLPYSRDQHHFSFSRIYIASDEDIPLRFRIEQSSYKTTLLGFNGTITITALD